MFRVPPLVDVSGDSLREPGPGYDTVTEDVLTFGHISWLIDSKSADTELRIQADCAEETVKLP